MEQLFGTDGIRGIPGQYPLLPEFISKIGFATVRLLGNHAHPSLGTPPAVLLGRDSRHSGPWIAKALQRGFVSAGYRILDLGMIPTPALAYLTPRRKATFGVMISASHNPPEFNGIKFFSAQGHKLEEQQERMIEGRLSDFSYSLKPSSQRLSGQKDERASADYLDFLKSTFPASLDLKGTKLVIDCANGAASYLGPQLLRDLGAEVFAIGCHPSGHNINLGYGALDLEAMRRVVVARKAACGFSLDGDADRAIFADSRGNILDGDVLIGLSAAHLRRCGLLRHNRVVTTVMANMGLIHYLKQQGIGVVQVPVGDRNVIQAMEREDLSLGGESSGHIVFRRFSCNGDGLLTALQILSILKECGKPIEKLREGLRLYPQVLKNVPVERKIPIEELPHFQTKLRSLQKSLEGKGRILVRYSGTEPLLRILVEGPTWSLVHRVCSEIIKTYNRNRYST
ncbi:MAG: phosphoglucosamine mutase [Elusimicrobia bacterium]|nr:phosphoglucosamine mutase [Elusimicrobiota bacterium]